MTNNKCLIVAEVGSVHDGSFGNAKKLIEIASNCGADVVKFQTHIASAETIRNAPTPPYFKDEPRFKYFERTGFSKREWEQLIAHSRQNKIELMSSPFSNAAVSLLEEVGVARYKVGSGEVTNLPLLDYIAQTGKPVLLSSGMSSWAELDEAVETILRRHSRLTVMQCTSEYPCPYEKVGLNVMLEIRDRYKLPVGLSDHTMTSAASIAAVSLGASVIEKHVTFSRLMYGSDAKHSLEPDEFKSLVEGVRAVELMLASPVDKDATAMNLSEMKAIFEKSIVTIVDIPAGSVLRREMLDVKKPGTGIAARRLSDVLGKKTVRHVAADTVLQEEDIDA
jgi:N-acetylneuraminate synthase